MTGPGPSVPPGWYPDPALAGQQRFWDGVQWTEHVQAEAAPAPAPPTAYQPTQAYEPPAPQPLAQQPPAPQPLAQQPAGPPPAGTDPAAPAPSPFGSPPPAGPPGLPPSGPPADQQPTASRSNGAVIAVIVVVVLGILLAGCLGVLVLRGSEEVRPVLETDDGPAVDDSATNDEPDTAASDDTAAQDADDPLGDPDADDATPAAGTDGGGTLEDPFPYDVPQDLRFQGFSEGDGSLWTTSIGPPRDITDDVLAENQFNDPPPDGVRFVGFEVSLTLVEADTQPLAPGSDFVWEILGGSTRAAYDLSTIETDSFGCGVVPGRFDDFAEVLIGGTVTGTVCLPLPAEDLDHPDTVVALNFFSADRIVFGP